MNLIRQSIEKKLELYNNYSIKKYTIRSIWQFYQAINLSCAVLRIHGIQGLSKKEIIKRNKLYKKIIFNQKLDENILNSIDLFIAKDNQIINQALDLIDNIQNQDSETLLNFEKDQFVAISGAEVEEFL